MTPQNQSEPFTGSHAAAESETVKAQQKRQRNLLIAYKQTFNNPRGKLVLADLEAKFGFNRPSAEAGMRNEEVWMREGMKMALWHIKAQMERQFETRTTLKKSRPKASEPETQ